MTLLDEVGIDVGGKVGLVLGEAFGARMAPSDAMRRVVAAAARAGRVRRGSTGTIRRERRGALTKVSMKSSEACVARFPPTRSSNGASWQW